MDALEDNSRSEVATRFISGLIFLSISIGAAIVLLVAVQSIEIKQLTGNFEYFENFFSFMDGFDWAQRLGIAAACTIVGTLSLTVMFRSFSKPAVSMSLHILDIDDMGIVFVSSRGVSTIAAQAAMSAHGVMDARVITKGASTAPVRLKVDVAIIPGANVKRAGIEAREAIRDALETLVGISVSDISVNAHIIESDALARRIR